MRGEEGERRRGGEEERRRGGGEERRRRFTPPWHSGRTSSDDHTQATQGNRVMCESGLLRVPSNS
eukprot:767425-Hanusia_phi.AAC.5